LGDINEDDVPFWSGINVILNAYIEYHPLFYKYKSPR
jgi:hypothetical protein